MALQLPGVTSGTAPGWLSKEHLAGITYEFWESYYNQLPLLHDFSERVSYSEKMLIQQFVQVLQIGNLTSRPEPGQKVDPTMFDAKLIKPFFDQYTMELSVAEFESLKDPTSDNMFARATLQQAVERMREHFGSSVQTYLRTLHYVCAKLMSTPGGASFTLNGETTVNYDFGFPTADFDADWATVTTNLQHEFAGMIAKFRRKNAGLAPNRLYVHHDFVRSFILENTDLNENFLPRSNDIMSDWVKLLGLPSAERDRVNGLKVIYVSDAINVETPSDTADGTQDDLTDIWPLNYITFARVDASEDNFKMNTLATLENDGKGGTGTRFFYKEDPLMPCVRFSGNYIPSWAKSQRVMIAKVSASKTTPDYPDDI